VSQCGLMTRECGTRVRRGLLAGQALLAVVALGGFPGTAAADPPRPDRPPVPKAPPPPVYVRPPPPLVLTPPPRVFAPAPSVSTTAKRHALAVARARARARAHARATHLKALRLKAARKRAEAAQARRVAAARVRAAERLARSRQLAVTFDKVESPYSKVVPILIALLAAAALVFLIALVPVRALRGYWSAIVLDSRRDDFVVIGGMGLLVLGVAALVLLLAG
jgi:hypothetical protein